MLINQALLQWRGLALAGVLWLLAACSGDASTALGEVPGGDATAGRTVMSAYGCGSCHTIPGVAGANAHVGPPLNEFAHRQYIAGTLPNTANNLVRWLMDPQGVEPGTAMPNMGVTEEDALDMAAYLATLE